MDRNKYQKFYKKEVAEPMYVVGMTENDIEEIHALEKGPTEFADVEKPPVVETQSGLVKQGFTTTRVNFRKEPSLFSEIVQNVPKGHAVLVYEVRDSDDGLFGCLDKEGTKWVKMDFIEMK